MKPNPKDIGSVVASERCAFRGCSRGGSATPGPGWRNWNAVPLLVPLVIIPHSCAGQARDRGLEMPKEPDRLERPVAPSRGDAVPGVIRPLMMRRMLGAPQKEAAVLKNA